MSRWAYLDAAISLPSRRFHQSLTDNNRWIRERSHESYAKNYSVVFPHDEPLAGRNVRKDPLHEVRMRTPTRAALRGAMGRPSQHPCSRKEVARSGRSCLAPQNSVLLTGCTLRGCWGRGQFNGRGAKPSSNI